MASSTTKPALTKTRQKFAWFCLVLVLLQLFDRKYRESQLCAGAEPAGDSGPGSAAEPRLMTFMTSQLHLFKKKKKWVFFFPPSRCYVADPNKQEGDLTKAKNLLDLPRAGGTGTRGAPRARPALALPLRSVNRLKIAMVCFWPSAAVVLDGLCVSLCLQMAIFLISGLGGRVWGFFSWHHSVLAETVNRAAPGRCGLLSLNLGERGTTPVLRTHKTSGLKVSHETVCLFLTFTKPPGMK